MNNIKLKLSGIIGMGVLVTSPTIGVENQTCTFLIESNYYSNPSAKNLFILKDNSEQFYNSHFYFKHDIIKLGTDPDIDEYYEPEVVEIPIVKRMLFQFKKPVKLEFS